jgi:putative acetyltransferase
MSIHLRPGSSADHEMLAEVWEAAWSETMPGIDFSERRDFILGQLQASEAGRYQLRVAEIAGARIGFTLTESQTGLLEQIAVHPARWGGGVAKALIDDAKARSRGHLALFVNQQNPRAVRFYLREGFEIRGEGTNPNSGLPTFRMEWEGSPVMR